MSTISRFVRPETVTIPISDGDTLTVRKQLSYGERRAMFARWYDLGATPVRVNTLQTGIALVAAYLVDWTLSDEEGQKVPIRGLSIDELVTVIDQLHPDAFAEIKTAIEAHIEAIDAAEAQEKKRMTAGAVA